MEAITPVLLLGMFVSSLIDWLKEIRGRDYNAAFTRAAVWVAGVLAAAVFVQTSFATGVTIAGQRMSLFNAAEIIVFGVLATSLMHFLYDTRKAIDNTDTAAKPALLRVAKAVRRRE